MSTLNFGRRGRIVIYTPLVEVETQPPVKASDNTSSTVTQPKYYEGYELNDIDFSCNIAYGMSTRNNNDKPVSLTLRGLPIDSSLIQVGAFVEIMAGYESHGTGGLTTLFAGIIAEFTFNGNMTGTGSTVSLVLMANNSVSKVAKVSATYPTNTSIRLIADDMSKLLNAPITMSNEIGSKLLEQPAYFYGNALDELSDFLKDKEYSITYNVSGYYITSTSAKEEAYSLYTEYKPSAGQVLSGLARSSNKGQTVATDGSSLGNLKLSLLLMYIPPMSVITLDETFGSFMGSYITEGITYALDTNGANWYTTLELKLRPDIKN